MLAISYKTNFNLSNLEVDKIIQVGLVNASQRVQKVAQANAPYETGKLKQGIGVEPNNIGKGVKQVRVWPRSIAYAVRREYENFKNPDRKFYMKRTAESSSPIVQKAFDEASKIAIERIRTK